MRNQPIERVMTSPAIVIGSESTLDEAGGLMAHERLHHLPVVEGDRLVGIVSATDLIIHATGSVPDVGQRRIGEIMHRDPIALSRSATLDDAAVLLAGGRYHSLPVTDAAGRVVGIVTSTDLIGVLLRHLPSKAGVDADQHRTPPGLMEEFADPVALEACLNDAERQRQSGGKVEPLARALLYLAGRSRDLENVRRAADIYLHSGQGEHEHAALVRALEKAREHFGPGLAM